jgi:tetratricopeptide (TPR) repeat protein
MIAAMRSLAAVMTLCLAVVAFPEARQGSPSQLARNGWAALNAGRISEASVAFDAAMKVAPEQPALLLGAGIAARLGGREDDARRLLVEALKIQPALTEASLVLGAVLYQSGDIDGAIDVYEKALVHAPAHPRIVQQLEAWRKESDLHSGFHRKLASHFTVLFEGPAEADLADRAVAILDEAYLRVGTALYTYPSEVITVVLYTREQFHDITQSPDWAGGAYDGRIRVPVQGALADVGEFRRVLTHEFTHALVHSIAGRAVPFWLDEGLAVRFEASGTEHAGRRLVAARPVLPLARLEQSFATLSAAEAGAAYAQSASAVEAMFDEAGGAAVVSLLEAIATGTPFPEAFERSMLISYAEFQKKFRS